MLVFDDCVIFRSSVTFSMLSIVLLSDPMDLARAEGDIPLDPRMVMIIFLNRFGSIVRVS